VESKVSKYTAEHAAKGKEAKLPKLEVWPNQYNRNYEITMVVPEYTSVCPKTGLPDFGTVTIRYIPDRTCIELKSLKYYLLGYRNMGIFYENAMNKILDDLVAACKPKWMSVKGEFNTRGGMHSIIECQYPPVKTP
jgi:7-cyano-7-deazaguanine reductase